MNILLKQFYFKQINAGLEINATYLGLQTKSLGAQMEYSCTKCPHTIGHALTFCVHTLHDTHTHHLRVLAVNSLATPQRAEAGAYVSVMVFLVSPAT